MRTTDLQEATRQSATMAAAFHAVADRRQPSPKIRNAMIDRTRSMLRWTWSPLGMDGDDVIDQLLHIFGFVPAAPA